MLKGGGEGGGAKRKALYEGAGFSAMPPNPLRLFLPLGAVRSLIEGLP